MPHADCHCRARPMPGQEPACGDAGLVVTDESACFVALLDVLGHGPEAAGVAGVARAYLAAHCREPLPELMQGLHEHLKGSRGLVAFLGRFALDTGLFHYVGIGNIAAKVFGPDDPASLVSKDGVIGYMMSTPREKSVRLLPRDIVLLCSDGVREHFDLLDYPSLLLGDAQAISGAVLDQLAKGTDDASCLVLRCLK